MGVVPPRRKEVVSEELEAHLERRVAEDTSPWGWRKVFGQARQEEVEEIDAIAEEFERIDPLEWR